MANNDGTLVIMNARLVFRNFAGKEGMYNREGDRSFCILLDDQLATSMMDDGWNIKTLKPREDDLTVQPYVQVSVGYKGRPPKVVLITSKGRTTLTEDEVEILDWVDIGNVDLIVRPYNWVVNGKSGVKAYLKSIFLTVEETQLDLKYAHLEELDALPSRSGRIIEGVDYIDGEVVDETRAIESGRK